MRDKTITELLELIGVRNFDNASNMTGLLSIKEPSEACFNYGLSKRELWTK